MGIFNSIYRVRPAWHIRKQKFPWLYMNSRGSILQFKFLKSVLVINRHLELLSDGNRIKYEKFLWKPPGNKDGVGDFTMLANGNALEWWLMLFSLFLGDNTIAFQRLLMSFCLWYSGYICMSTNRDQKYILCHHRRRRNCFCVV